MKEYLLSIKKGETINATKAHSLEEAIIYFSKIKKLTQKALTDIYNVSCKENQDNLFCESYNKHTRSK
jgi:hypothetical protein